MRPSIDPLTSSAMTRSTSRRAPSGAALAPTLIKPAQQAASSARRYGRIAGLMAVSRSCELRVPCSGGRWDAFQTWARKTARAEFTQALQAERTAPARQLFRRLSAGDLEPKPFVRERAADRLAVLLGDAFAPRDFVPTVFHGLLHRIDTRFGFVAIDEEARALGAQVIGMGVTAHVAAGERQVAALDADLRVR